MRIVILHLSNTNTVNSKTTYHCFFFCDEFDLFDDRLKNFSFTVLTFFFSSLNGGKKKKVHLRKKGLEKLDVCFLGYTVLVAWVCLCREKQNLHNENYKCFFCLFVCFFFFLFWRSLDLLFQIALHVMSNFIDSFLCQLFLFFSYIAISCMPFLLFR